MENKSAVLESVRQNEIQKFSKPFRFLSNVTIESTSNIQSSYKINTSFLYKDFKPQKTIKLVFISLLTCVFIIPAKYALNNSFTNLPHLLFILIPVLLFILVLIWFFFLDNNLNYTIHIDKEGILISNQLHKWIDISETAILTSGNGKSRREYLIIISKDTLHSEKFNLKNFNGFSFYSIGFRISKYIEFFKSPPPQFLSPQAVR